MDQVSEVGFTKATLEGVEGSTIVCFRAAGILVAKASVVLLQGLVFFTLSKHI